ncbi:hypothetical protein NIE88_09015 [Sporolactobacillus shoreicorticis]|uniref:Uncharacterized protein n=1 Tax=Sporolactobacillus shoreicorticis TaxID=1923877 RepID=A0ABW5S421_9BACL|nr:hypothetical protein [Sporolactobacillus shoreicorticis]MCO7125912.1 hypothetical protein [Sporolactobacillus shoreicorticis]
MLFYTYELSTLDVYDYMNHEYYTIETDIFNLLQTLVSEFSLYQYWISKSGKGLNDIIIDLPVQSKKNARKKEKIFIGKMNDFIYYKNEIVAFDQLIGISKEANFDETFTNKIFNKENFKCDLLKTVDLQIEITDSASIKITSAHAKVIRDVVRSMS